MYTRDKAFYDIVNHGLASLGYTGPKAFDAYVNDMFAEKYNAEKTFSQVGFPLNPDIPINPTYEQIEATIRPYTMATYVDIDSDGATKSTDGLELKMGTLPTFKHEVVMSRKIIREKMMLMDMIGSSTPEIEGTIMDILFNGVDDLIGGNYNTMLYQRHQVVSNFGKLVINGTNNPFGIPIEIDFGVPSKNKKTSQWYTKSGDTVTQDPAVGVTVDPISVLKKAYKNAKDKDFMPSGHWEVDSITWDDLMSLSYFKEQYVLGTRPDITDSSTRAAFANTIDDDTVKAYIEKKIGAKIVVVDAIAAVEKYDKSAGKMSYENLRSFNEGVMVLVPDGAIGDSQFGKPIFMETPGARTALYDGGRTLIRQLFNDENMVQVIKSEVTGLVVPNKTRWMYYYTVKG